MKTFLFISSFVGLMAWANAECANSCSGRGRCTNFEAKFKSSPDNPYGVPTAQQATFGYDTSSNKKDSCTCFTKIDENGDMTYQFHGVDCSLKVCPHGASFGGAPYTTNDHTQKVACSNQGLCDSKTGECNCFVGYTGASCNRKTCPNSCSGNGQCLSLMELAELALETSASHNYQISAKYTTAFDRQQSYACLCDSGFTGSDCSVQTCPSGADPMGGEGASKGRVCSGRGLCKDGACACFSGFFGTDCKYQRAKTN